LINVRGQILSVIDLRVFFDLPQSSVTGASKVLILRSGDMEVGVVADGVVEARSLPLDGLSPALPTLTGLRAAYLRGIADGDLVILDAAKLLADKSLVVNEQVDGE
jgi:purine-binding chemotaxis protein CheW